MPQTPAVRKRRFVVSFHVDENELSFLNRQVAASSLNREEYLRTLIAGKQSIRAPARTMPICSARWQGCATMQISLPTVPTVPEQQGRGVWMK